MMHIIRSRRGYNCVYEPLLSILQLHGQNCIDGRRKPNFKRRARNNRPNATRPQVLPQGHALYITTSTQNQWCESVISSWLISRSEVIPCCHVSAGLKVRRTPGAPLMKSVTMTTIMVVTFASRRDRIVWVGMFQGVPLGSS